MNVMELLHSIRTIIQVLSVLVACQVGLSLMSFFLMLYLVAKERWTDRVGRFREASRNATFSPAVPAFPTPPPVVRR